VSVAYGLNQFYLQKPVRRGQIERCRSDGVIKTGLKYGLNWLSMQILRGQSGWGMALTTHPPSSTEVKRNTRSTLLPPLWAFTACPRVQFTRHTVGGISDRLVPCRQTEQFSAPRVLFMQSASQIKKNDINIEFMTIADLRYCVGSSSFGSDTTCPKFLPSLTKSVKWISS